ncbi:calcium-binding protein [Streptomyces sp900105245]|uniref:calcium-binding protein n=1 Tax=Streptomyces sp. 900105245 TaxID=3154379 RepID=UPI00332ECB51
MRIRASVTVLSGALVLSSALVVPATAQAHAGPTTDDDTTITKVVVNGGKDIVLGTSAKKSFTATVTAADPDGIAGGWVALWHGTSFDEQDRDGVLLPAEEGSGLCVAADAQTSTCTVHFTVDPKSDMTKNSYAGTWHAYAIAYGRPSGSVSDGYAGSVHIKRNTTLTADASPEPVAHGRTITVKGTLTRANWETHKYAGLSNVSVKLQFRKSGTSTYKTLKTVTSGSGGAVKATTTATSDGYYRFSYAGTSATHAATSASDFVNVQ